MLDQPIAATAANPSVPKFASPPLLAKRPPRCPPMLEITTSDQLLPYLDVVAKRPYNQGLHACWDLKRGERVLLRVDNWHDPMVVEACKKILEKYGCKYEIVMADKGPVPQWVGADEVEYYLLPHQGARRVDGPVGRDVQGRQVRQAAVGLWRAGAGRHRHEDPAHAVHHAGDPGVAGAHDALRAAARDRQWTWERVRSAKRVRINDPEGTDVEYTNHAGYYDRKREFLNPDLVAQTWTGNEQFGRTYLPGHVLGKPWIYLPGKGGRQRRHRRHDQPHRAGRLDAARGREQPHHRDQRRRRVRRQAAHAEGRDRPPPVPGLPRQGADVLVGGVDRHQSAHPPPAQGLPVRAGSTAFTSACARA